MFKVGDTVKLKQDYIDSLTKEQKENWVNTDFLTMPAKIIKIKSGFSDTWYTLEYPIKIWKNPQSINEEFGVTEENKDRVFCSFDEHIELCQEYFKASDENYKEVAVGEIEVGDIIVVTVKSYPTGNEKSSEEEYKIKVTAIEPIYESRVTIYGKELEYNEGDKNFDLDKRETVLKLVDSYFKSSQLEKPVKDLVPGDVIYYGGYNKVTILYNQLSPGTKNTYVMVGGNENVGEQYEIKNYAYLFPNNTIPQELLKYPSSYLVIWNISGDNVWDLVEPGYFKSSSSSHYYPELCPPGYEEVTIPAKDVKEGDILCLEELDQSDEQVFNLYTVTKTNTYEDNSTLFLEDGGGKASGDVRSGADEVWTVFTKVDNYFKSSSWKNNKHYNTFKDELGEPKFSKGERVKTQYWKATGKKEGTIKNLCYDLSSSARLPAWHYYILLDDPTEDGKTTILEPEHYLTLVDSYFKSSGEIIKAKDVKKGDKVRFKFPDDLNLTQLTVEKITTGRYMNDEGLFYYLHEKEFEYPLKPDEEVELLSREGEYFKSSNLQPEEQFQVDLVEKLMPEVAILYGALGERAWSGTAFKINNNDLLTCAHCVDFQMVPPMDKNTTIWISFGEHDFWKCNVRAINYELDVAVITPTVPSTRPEWL